MEEEHVGWRLQVRCMWAGGARGERLLKVWGEGGEVVGVLPAPATHKRGRSDAHPGARVQ
jgi:hypothetical protein